MFIIDIALNIDLVPKEKQEELFEAHRTWYHKHFEEGDFLIVGPFKNKGAAGVVIAKANSIEEIEKIISEDSFYPEFATYEISEFTANLVADNITDYKGK